jgi:hypothetical protein
MADDFYGSEPYTDDDDFEVRIFDSSAPGTPVGRPQKPLPPDDSIGDLDSFSVEPQTGGHSAASVPLQQRRMIRSTPAARLATQAAARGEVPAPF